MPAWAGISFVVLGSEMNPIDTAGSFSTPFERSRGRTADHSAGMRGQMGAEQLEVEADASMLAEAAEEISLHHAESAESKHVAERKKELARPRSLMSSEAIESYLEDTGEDEEGSAKLLSFVQRVLSGDERPFRYAQQAFLRPASQYLALQYALQQGEREGASEQTLEGLLDAIDQLEVEHGPRIRADINTIGAAAEEGSGPAGVAQFQLTYVDLVLGHATLAGALNLVLDQFGDTGLVAGLERLQRALGQDLAAARPSTSVEHLQNLMQDLYYLGVANTVLERCKELQAQMQARHGIGADGAPVALMKDLVGLSSETWVSSDRFIRLAEAAGAAEVEPQINFLTGIKGLLRDMPPRIFVDKDQRQNVLTAAQDALDVAIDREEG